jgi:hypothetical protein
MTTSDYIALGLFLLLVVTVPLDIARYMKVRRLLLRAISIIGELVLINNTRVAKDSQDHREFNDAAALSAQATQLLQDAR